MIDSVDLKELEWLGEGGEPTPHHVVTVREVEPVMEPDQRFHPLSIVGRGGMGVVTRSQDMNLHRTVAVKSIKPTLATDPRARRELMEEAQITAQLDHPNIVPVYELGRKGDGELYFAMKLVQGRTLTDMLEEMPDGPMSASALYKLLGIFLKVCDAVAFAHARRVIHQDLKPDNIMVGEFGEVYLMDWGIARLVQARTPAEGKPHIQGTLAYMAPERLLDPTAPANEQTDIFSLGGILYQMLAFRPPYLAGTRREMMEQVCCGCVDPVQLVVPDPLPPRLCAIVTRALAADPAERYGTVTQLKADVEDFLQSGARFTHRTVRAGEIVVREGDEGAEAYVVLKGRCVAWRMEGERKDVLREFKEGDVFGETAVFTHKVRSATVQAEEDTVLGVVTKADFEEMGMNRMLGMFVRALAERFREADMKAAELARELARRT